MTPRARPRRPARRLHRGSTLSGTQTGLIVVDGRVPPDRRCFPTSTPYLGLAAAVLAAVSSSSPWASVGPPPLPETPAFQEEGGRRGADVPVAELFRTTGIDVLRVALRARVRREHDLRRLRRSRSPSTSRRAGADDALWSAVAANLVALSVLPYLAILADRVGRRPVFVRSAPSDRCPDVRLPAAISQANYLVIITLPRSSQRPGLQRDERRPAVALRRDVPTRVRCPGPRSAPRSGSPSAGFGPDGGRAWIAGEGPGGWVPVAAYVFVSSLIAAGAVMTARETFNVTLDEIDGRERRAATGRFTPATRAAADARAR